MDDRCFEYSIVVALCHKEIKNLQERIQSNHHLLSVDYNWGVGGGGGGGIDFPTGTKEWK